MTKQQNKETIKFEQILKSSTALEGFVATSEQFRKRFSERLRQTLSENGELSNQIYELSQNRRLTHISYEIVQDKLNMLYESIDAISNAKKIEEMY